MKNFVSAINHPESPQSGSTLESMISKVKSQGNKYFAVTDNGYFNSVLKAYMHGKKEGIGIIPGVDAYFKDFNCEIAQNTPAENIKYYKVVLHAMDQASYQILAKTCSDFSKKTITVMENEYALIDWKDLELFSTLNITVSTSDIEDIVSKNLLVNRPDIALKYYQKLSEMFKDKYYPSLITTPYSQFWNKLVRVTTEGASFDIPIRDRVEIQGESRSYARDLFNRFRSGKETLLTSVYVNKFKYPVKAEMQKVTDVKVLNDYQVISAGDLQLRANKFIYAVAQKTGYGKNLLISNYSYYSDYEDKVVQNMRLIDDKQYHQHQHIQSSEEAFKYLSESVGICEEEFSGIVENTHTWSEKFKDLKFKYDYQLPDVGEDPKGQMLAAIKNVGRMKWDDERYVKQFKEEFELLNDNGVVGLAPYFLPLVDVYRECRENNVLNGPARGSAAGFLLSYLIGITHVDPIKYDLSSSRFITIDRINEGGLPDIDSDFSSRDFIVGKDGNSGYLFNKYGNKISQLSTRTMLRLKSAILDANRFKNGGEVEESIAKLSKSLPTTPQGISDKKFVFGYTDDEGNHVDGIFDKNADLQEYAKQRPDEWETVKRALSLARQNSRHACSWVIGNKPIVDTVPTFTIGGVKGVAQTEAKQAEFAGLIKYDFLCVKALDDIRVALNYINTKHSKKLEVDHFDHNGVRTFIWDLPEDEKVYKMLSDGHTESVFQLNTVSVTPFVKAIKPNNIIDLATIAALVRPGPLDFVDPLNGRNMAEEYIERRYERSQSDIPILGEMLPETYGILIYQEQIVKIAKQLGKMSVSESENVRIAMGKKKQELLDSLKPKFIQGASETVDKATAEKIWAMMETFARYGFNKCISGDTVILKNKNNNKSLTVEEMYLAKNHKDWAKENNKESVGKKYRLQGYGKGWSKNGDRIYPNDIVDIRFEGEREVYRITTESGRTIKTTDNHKFPTPNGDMELKDLKLGDLLFVNLGSEITDNTHRFGAVDNLPKLGQRGFQKTPPSSSKFFTERRAILVKTHEQCQICNLNLKNKRKELHHKDGNHDNQDWDNLTVTCPSCHKIEHYKLGRTKQGQRGLLVGTESIVKIESCGTENVYDVEMAAPHHNFTVDTGIVTCNSHSVSYVIISYACAFLKHHYPLEWWAAVLSNAEDKEINEVFYKYVKDMVLPPDINISKEAIAVDYKISKLRNKLSMISKLGPKVAEKIISLRPYEDILDFVRKNPCGHSMGQKLAIVGALDSLLPQGLDVVGKHRLYIDAIEQVSKEEKIEKQQEKITLESDEKKKDKLIKALATLIETPAKEGKLDPKYSNLYHPLKLYSVQKSIFPTMNLDLDKIIIKCTGNFNVVSGNPFPLISFKGDVSSPLVKLVKGETLQKLDTMTLSSEAMEKAVGKKGAMYLDFAVAGYVMDSKEFDYAKGTKKALKLVIDSSGYVSERVIWPNRDGILEYPKDLKKGAVGVFFYSKKVDSDYTSLRKVIVETIN